MNILEPIFVASFTADTYSCIKGRGIHKAYYNVKEAFKDREGTKYCLKLDVKKFFPNIDHEILKQLLRRKFKDKELFILLDEIIDSTDGLPIGNYLSSCLANFYMTYFDHWLKEEMGVKYYFRYCDDLVILSDSKEYLHKLRIAITNYLKTHLKLSVKKNYQVFPVAARSLNFVGYKIYHTHTLLRPSIKDKFVRMIRRNKNYGSVVAYFGWISHCNGKNLLKKYLR